MANLGAKKPVGGVRILTYHRIAEDQGDPFAVPSRDFAEQMAVLADSGVVTSLDKAMSALEGSSASEGPCIVLTFDDGTRDFISVAAPLLRRLNLPGTLYVCPSQVGSSGFLSWQDLEQLCHSGFEVGSHGLDHRTLGKVQPEELRHQVVESRRILEERLGCAVTSLAYPYGTLRDFNDLVKTEVRKAGYRSACTSINGINRRGCDSWALHRTKIEQGDNSIFRWILRGGLDGWSFIDRHLSVFQGRYG